VSNLPVIPAFSAHAEGGFLAWGMRTLLVTAIAGALVITATPAPAQSGSWADRANDVAGLPYLDLASVHVKHTKKAVRVTYRSRSRGNLNGTEILLLDTDRRRPGPELQVGFGRYSEGWSTPMRRWKVDRSKAAKRRWNPNPYGKPGTCDRTVRINSRWQKGFTPVTITVRKKKGCINSRRVRVQVSTATEGFSDLKRYEAFGSVLRDRLPNGARSFTPWLAQRSTRAPARRFVDGPDAVRWWSDIRAVAVDHTSERLSVTVRHLPRPVSRTGVFDVHLDTDGDAVPDWLIEVAPGNPVVRRATGWGSYGSPLACSIDGDLSPVGLTTTRFSMPTAPCLGDPGTVRVAVTSTDRASSAFRPIDWWAGVRRWSPAVARG
jgi:hypothetical protein